MQKVDHDRDQGYLVDNPGPASYDIKMPGKELAKDSVKYSMAGKIYYQNRKLLNYHLTIKTMRRC